MASALTDNAEGEGKVQTTNPLNFKGAAKAEVVSITRRSLVQIQPPLPNNRNKVTTKIVTLFLCPEDPNLTAI